MSTLRYVFSSDGSGRPYCRQATFENRTKDNACVVFDGDRVVLACEVERITQMKHDFRRANCALEALQKKVPEPILPLECPGIHESTRNHHLSHIFETFYQSGFKEAAVFVNDGIGTLNECITLAYMKENEDPIIFAKYGFEISPCNLYHLISKSIFGSENTEGRLMGLAGYGSDNGRKYIHCDTKNKNFVVDEIVFKDVAELPKFETKEFDVMSAKDIAWVVQKDFENAVLQAVRDFRKILDENGISTKNLCFSGGGVLNCPANSKIVDLNLFDHYYASPQPSDGCAESVGKALKCMFSAGECLISKRLESAYLGVTYTEDDLYCPKEHLRTPSSTICDFLANKGVILWFQGGAEYGPRALGHRSFLADPSDKEMLDALNKIKGRESWRPLAPVVPEELFKHVFEVDNTDMCEFMLRTLKIKEKWQPRLRAVCHVDGTTRPQLLKRETNPELYALLMAYFEKTGCPCLINTSLNINGFPIVETPTDLCDLQEEIGFMTDIPENMTIFVRDNKFWEVMGINPLIRKSRKSRKSS